MAVIEVLTDEGEGICSWVIDEDPDEIPLKPEFPGLYGALQDALRKDLKRARR